MLGGTCDTPFYSASDGDDKTQNERREDRIAEYVKGDDTNDAASASRWRGRKWDPQAAAESVHHDV